MKYKSEALALVDEMDEHRKEQGISIKDISYLAGYESPTSVYQAWLYRGICPRLSTFLRLADVLDLELTLTPKQK